MPNASTYSGKDLPKTGTDLMFAAAGSVTQDVATEYRARTPAAGLNPVLEALAKATGLAKSPPLAPTTPPSLPW